ncbi:helix-turn-helix transcriptional regulator [Streptomyces sp. NPDC093109]|uniref:helix-turn-helix domain-containing protein n=1 Tax=Streptomyces sp. NPDC093109 TaxID=3154977 RepID=UPI00344C1AEA
MSDYQQARVALGMRLRELRKSRSLTGAQLAELLGWTQSKVSKLENGRQTATADDLQRWAAAVERPDTAGELTSRLAGLESHMRSWRRQLATGHKAVQETLNTEFDRTRTFRAWEGSMIVGSLQTADYARHIFSRYTDLHQSLRDTEDAVRARMKRQAGLYEAGNKYRIILWEAALHALVCPPSVLAAQLDRLAGVIGMDTVELGIIPFSAPLRIPPANAFWIFDERLVIVEDWHAELWVEDRAGIATYLRVWDMLNGSAVYGADAHRIITRAGRMLDAR